ncbi:hypothetical protein SLA2020_024770 [Shorea laevis]
MGFSILFLFLISSAFHINLTSSAEIAADFRKSCDSSNGDFIANSAYEDNLNLLFSKLVDQDFNDGFYNVSVGQSPDQVNAIALCRGDKKEDICRSCLKNTTYALQQNCDNKKEAIGWSEFCTLRYSNRQIYGVMETDPFDKIYRVDNKSKPSDVDGFNRNLCFLLKNLSNSAATGGPLFKYAAGVTKVSVSPSGIYALVQCTPDLSQQDCSTCLEKSIEKMGKYCSGRSGCRILQPSCNLRYEIGQFFDGVVITVDVPSSPPPTEVPSTGNENNQTGTIIVVEKGNNATRTIIISIVTSVVASLVGSLSLILCIWIILRRQKAKKIVERK